MEISDAELNQIRLNAQKNLSDSVKSFKDKTESNTSLNKELIELGVSGFSEDETSK